MDNPKKPPASKVYEIADRAGTLEEALRLLGAAFPQAEVQYIAGLYRQRAAEQLKIAERYELEGKAAEAAANFLASNDYENLKEAGDYLGLTPQELWDQIMQEAGVPQHEMPEFIQTGWEH